MSTQIEEFNRLKELQSKAKSRADKAAGALAQLKQRLKAEFQCSTLKEAKALLEKIKKDKAKAEASFKAAMKGLQEKWGSLLGDPIEEDK